jgi:post-segregation antitoxin (ccd killing protein)
VYLVCMARVNIYLPDDLARRAREAGLNVSGVAQAAIESQLKIRAVNDWLERVRARPPLKGVTHEQVIWAVDEAREEFGRAADTYIDPERYAAEVEAIGGSS